MCVCVCVCVCVFFFFCFLKFISAPLLFSGNSFYGCHVWADNQAAFHSNSMLTFHFELNARWIHHFIDGVVNMERLGAISRINSPSDDDRRPIASNAINRHVNRQKDRRKKGAVRNPETIPTKELYCRDFPIE